MKCFTIKNLSITVPLMMLLAGCQTTGGLTTDSASKQVVQSVNEEIQLSQAEQAKKELQEAISRQLRSAFSFQTDIKLSNAKRRAALANATPEQLASTGDKSNYCEDIHDNAYVELLKKAESEGYDIENSRYDSQRATLISNYQVCDKGYDEWYESYYNGDNTEEYMPDYDENHTAKDAKKAEVQNAYLYEPLDMKVIGSYQPMAGKISMLPSVQFDSRNLFFNVRQPIYIDVNEGAMYIWAENFALLTSMLADENLGSQWKNKWLKIDLDDGSLPEGFSKGLFKSSIEAMKTAYEQEPMDDFSYLTSSELSDSLPYLNASQYEFMSGSNRIVSRVQNVETVENQTYLMQKTLFENIKEKYPEVFVIDGDESKQVSSRDLIRSFMEYLEDEIDAYEYDIEMEKDSDEKVEAERIVIRQHFGLNRGKLAWMQTRYELENKKIPNEGMMVNALTRFDRGGSSPFSSMSETLKMPTETNSIDARSYMEYLVKHYESGEGTVLGKLFFSGFMNGYKSEDHYPNQISKEASAEAIASKEDTKPKSSSRIVVDTRDDIEANEIEGYESAQCVLISVSLEMMCSESDIDINDAEAVQSCAKEKAEMTEAYNTYCQ